MRKRWVTEFKQSKAEGCLEYSVLIDGTHGQKSWGWGDSEEKFILFECEGRFPEEFPSKEEQAKWKNICKQFAELLNTIKFNLE